jgi:hypothetical protein
MGRIQSSLHSTELEHYFGNDELSDFLKQREILIRNTSDRLLQFMADDFQIKLKQERQLHDEQVDVAMQGYKFLGDVYLLILNSQKTIPHSLKDDNMHNNLMKVYQAINFIYPFTSEVSLKYQDLESVLNSRIELIKVNQMFPAVDCGFVTYSLDRDKLEEINTVIKNLHKKNVELDSKAFFGFLSMYRSEKVRRTLSNMYNQEIKFNFGVTQLGEEVQGIVKSLPYSLNDYLDSIKSVVINVQNVAQPNSSCPFASYVGMIKVMEARDPLFERH